MATKVKITDLLDPKKFEKYEPELTHYFEEGGTWQELLGYDESAMDQFYKSAYDLYQASNYTEAASVFSYLTTLNPYNVVYWMGLGISRQSHHEYEEATAAYIIAGAVDKHNPIPPLHLAQCYYALNEKKLARKHLRESIDLCGNLFEYKEVKQKAQVLLDLLPR